MTQAGFHGHTNPLESTARTIAHGAQELIQGITPRPRLTREEKREADEALKDKTIVCTFCAGLHAGPSSPACPRLASGKVNGDGTVVEFTFWRDDEWDKSRVVYLEDAIDEPEDDDEPHG